MPDPALDARGEGEGGGFGRRRRNRYRFMYIESRFAFALAIIGSPNYNDNGEPVPATQAFLRNDYACNDGGGILSAICQSISKRRKGEPNCESLRNTPD